MSLTIRYESVTIPLFTEDLTTSSSSPVIRDSISFTHRAEMGDVGSSVFIVHDDDGTSGHSNDAFRAYKTLRVNESAAPSGNQNIWTGYVDSREYRRSTIDKAGPSSRDIVVNSRDINAAAGFEIFHDGDGDRPIETVSQRITWLIASGYLNCAAGMVETSAVSMDAYNYDGQAPAAVLEDCALKASFNWFMYWDPSGVGTSLAFFDANTSTIYSSARRITNDLTAVASNTYFPHEGTDATLLRQPRHVYSGVYLTYDGGARYGREYSTASNFALRDGTVSMDSVKTTTAASTMIATLLDQASTEADMLTCTIDVPAAEVNDIRAGQRIEVQFTHLPGYETYRWCRVLSKTVTMFDRDDRYVMELALSPQCATTTAASIVQQGYVADGDAYPVPTAAGDVIIWAVWVRDDALGGTPVGWTAGAQYSGGFLFDDSIAVYYKVSEGDTHVPVLGTGGVDGYFYEMAGSDFSSITSAITAGLTGTAVSTSGAGHVFGFARAGVDDAANPLYIEAPPYTLDAQGLNHYPHPHWCAVHRRVTTAGAYSPTVTWSGAVAGVQKIISLAIDDGGGGGSGCG